jgi:hypothetical protein
MAYPRSDCPYGRQEVIVNSVTLTKRFDELALGMRAQSLGVVAMQRRRWIRVSGREWRTIALWLEVGRVSEGDFIWTSSWRRLHKRAKARDAVLLAL